MNERRVGERDRAETSRAALREGTWYFLDL